LCTCLFTYLRACVHVGARVRVCVCACACVRACVRVPYQILRKYFRIQLENECYYVIFIDIVCVETSELPNV